jgi:hypothetical protein
MKYLFAFLFFILASPVLSEHPEQKIWLHFHRIKKLLRTFAGQDAWFAIQSTGHPTGTNHITSSEVK